MVRHLLLVTCAAGFSLASRVVKRQSQTATVNLSQMQGAPQHFASGFLYGIPDTPNQIPAHFYSEIAFNYGRAGGAQLPAKGYMDGVDQYRVCQPLLEARLLLTICSLVSLQCYPIIILAANSVPSSLSSFMIYGELMDQNPSPTSSQGIMEIGVHGTAFLTKLSPICELII